MDAIKNLDMAKPTGFPTPYHAVTQELFAPFLLSVSLIFPGGVLTAKPLGTGGGKPLPPARIFPVSFGVPAECDSTEGASLINNHADLPEDLNLTAFNYGPGPDQFRRRS